MKPLLLALALVGCSSVEDLPSQAERIYQGLSECADHLTGAEFEACGEAVLDGFEMEWACSCIGGETWTTCATRDEAKEEVNNFPDGLDESCKCDRVGTCGL